MSLLLTITFRGPECPRIFSNYSRKFHYPSRHCRCLSFSNPSSMVPPTRRHFRFQCVCLTKHSTRQALRSPTQKKSLLSLRSCLLCQFCLFPICDTQILTRIYIAVLLFFFFNSLKSGSVPSRRRWEVSIKMDIREMECEAWIRSL